MDSAVAALLLRDAGHDVAGLFMKNWDDDDGTEYCTAAQDLLEAEAACHRLGIELMEVNFARQYWDDVFAHFLNEYAAAFSLQTEEESNSGTTGASTWG